MQFSNEKEMFYGAKPKMFARAKELRMNMTPAEQRLWDELKHKRLGVRFRAQHPIDIFIVDFYCHSEKLVIEIDGGIHVEQKEYDIGRTAEMERYGIRVIRFTNEEIFSDIERVLAEIKACIHAE